MGRRGSTRFCRRKVLKTHRPKDVPQGRWDGASRFKRKAQKGLARVSIGPFPELHDHSLSEAGAAPAAAVAVGGPLRRRDPPTDPNPLHISPADRYDRTRYRSRPSRNPHRMPRTARDLASRTSPANETRQLVTAMPEQHVPPDEKTLSIRQHSPRHHDCRGALGNG